MNREVHVRFWESAGLRCPAPLTFIKAYGSVAEARRGIGGWLSFYNEERPHQALDYRTPRAVFEGEACEHVDKSSRHGRLLPRASHRTVRAGHAYGSLDWYVRIPARAGPRPAAG
jgi:hypothetical protein